MTDQFNRPQPAPMTPASESDQSFDMSESSYKTGHAAMRKARRFALQGIYEWLMTDHRFDVEGLRDWKSNAPHDIAARTRANNAMHTVHLGYYHEMMRDIPEQIDALDALIREHLDRDLTQIDAVEHAILLIGAYELQSRLEIPYKVVLDEAMKLNNHFGATDAHKLINAVLDKLAASLRAVEVAAENDVNPRAQKSSTAKAQANAKNVTIINKKTLLAEQNKPREDLPSEKPRISANKTDVKRDRPKLEDGKNAEATTDNVAGESSLSQPKKADRDNRDFKKDQPRSDNRGERNKDGKGKDGRNRNDKPKGGKFNRDDSNRGSANRDDKRRDKDAPNRDKKPFKKSPSNGGKPRFDKSKSDKPRFDNSRSDKPRSDRPRSDNDKSNNDNNS